MHIQSQSGNITLTDIDTGNINAITETASRLITSTGALNSSAGGITDFGFPRFAR